MLRHETVWREEFSTSINGNPEQHENMKKSIILFSAFTFVYFLGQAQSSLLTFPQVYDFVFFRDTNAFMGNVDGAFIGVEDIEELKRANIAQSRHLTSSTMPKEIMHSITISPDMTFYSAVQSPDGDRWIFVERNMANQSYNICIHNQVTGLKSIAFSESNSPDTAFAFKPIYWSRERNIVYVEAFKFGSPIEHDGIWSYGLDSRYASKIPITPTYLSTPVFSPDGNFLIYLATDGSEKEIHSAANAIYAFELQQNKERLIEMNSHHYYSILGWLPHSFQK